MPAIRKPLEAKHEDKSFVVRFKHPVSRKVLRIWLGAYPGDAKIVQGKIDALNRVFLDPSQWTDPQGLPEDLAKIWRDASLGVQVKGGKVNINGKEITATAGQLAAMAAAIETLQGQLAVSRQNETKWKKMYEALAGRKARVGQCPTLREAVDAWKATYKGRDPEHTKIVGLDLERFVAKFGDSKHVDDLDGAEKSINDWLRSLETKAKTKTVDGKVIIVTPSKPISAGRRGQIRRHVLRFLEDSGLKLDRSKSGAMPAPKRSEVKKDRGSIRWLEKEQADELAKHLPQPWRDVFEIQKAIGLRPSEVPTLKKSDLTSDLSKLMLSPLGELTLKTGPRTITLSNFPDIQPTFKRLMEKASPDGVLFVNGGKPWDVTYFMKQYNAALKVAKAELKGPLEIGFKVDCRIGRRTCASLLIRDEKDASGKVIKRGRSMESVAKLLGDDPATIRQHYGDLQSYEA